jgi:hypothetical protein
MNACSRGTAFLACLGLTYAITVTIAIASPSHAADGNGALVTRTSPRATPLNPQPEPPGFASTPH